MFQTLIAPALGALLLVFWTVSCAWVLRPRAVAATVSTPSGPTGTGSAPHAALAHARAARGLTRNGLLNTLLTLPMAFLAVRLLFELPGWFQLAWGIAVLLAAYVVWRVVVLWPTATRERSLDGLITGHGMKSVGLPWTPIIAVALLLALWFVPPLFLF